MKIATAFAGVARLHIDTAPLIYFVEQNATYVDRMRAIIQRLQSGDVDGFSSVITLTEVLTHPLRVSRPDLESAYLRILTRNRRFRLLPVTQTIARQAAALRATYNLKTPDALQLAAALEARCDAFLTNDRGLVRVTVLRIILVDDLDNP